MEINIKELISLIDKYIELVKLERCDIRVIETLIQAIMSCIPVDINIKLEKLDVEDYEKLFKKHSCECFFLLFFIFVIFHLL